MSFPYTITSPPPTSGILSIVGEANSSSGPYGGGSGPGPSTIGPNPVVSSLTVNPLGQITLLNDNALDAQGIDFNIDAAGTSTLNFGISYVSDETGAGGNIALGNVLITSTTNAFQNLGANKLFLNDVYAAATPGAVIMNDPTNPGTAYVSSLRVSSINGAAPGGPSPSTYTDSLTVSSLTCLSSLSLPNSQTQGAIYISTQLTFCDLGQLSNSFLNISNDQDDNGNQVGLILLQPSFGDGVVGLWASSDGTAGIFSGNPPQSTGNPPSTLSVYADNVLMSSLTISSINGAAYPPAAALPEDAGFNTLQCSTLGVNTSVSVGGWTQPVITFGATNLNGSGTAVVTLDRSYTDPYYPFVTYRGTLGATTSTLSVSTVNADTFNIYGEANTQVQWMVCGN